MHVVVAKVAPAKRGATFVVVLDSDDVYPGQVVDVKYGSEYYRQCTVLGVEAVPQDQLTYKHLIGFVDPNPSSLRRKLSGGIYYFITLKTSQETGEEFSDRYDDAPSYEKYCRKRGTLRFEDD